MSCWGGVHDADELARARADDNFVVALRCGLFKLECKCEVFRVEATLIAAASFFF